MNGLPYRVMGVDPGTYTTGYGIIERQPSSLSHIDNGLIVPGRSLSLPKRLAFVQDKLEELLEKFQPDVVSIENVFVNRNPQSALALGHARGVALASVARRGIPISGYAPTTIKKTVAGSGRAKKFQIQMMVKTLLGLPEPPAEDAADALAMAICHCHHETEASIRDRLDSRPRR